MKLAQIRKETREHLTKLLLIRLENASSIKNPVHYERIERGLNKLTNEQFDSLTLVLTCITFDLK